MIELGVAFAIGYAEFFVGTGLTDAIAKHKELLSMTLALISIGLWFYVTGTYAVDYQSKIPEIIAYSFGAAAGIKTMFKMTKK